MKIGGRLAVMGILLICWVNHGFGAIELGGTAGLAVSTNENMSTPFAFSLFTSVYVAKRTMVRLEYSHLEYRKELVRPHDFDAQSAESQQTPRVKSFFATFEAELIDQLCQYRWWSVDIGLGAGLARVKQQRSFRVWSLPGPGKNDTDLSPLFSLTTELRLRPWSDLPARFLFRLKQFLVISPEYSYHDYRPGCEYQVWGVIGAVLDF